MKTKEITINGVSLRLYKLGAIEQQKIFDAYFVPCLGAVGESYTPQADDKAILCKLPSILQTVLPPAQRQELLFDKLLSGQCVKILASGMELELVTIQNGVRAVTSSELDDMTALWQVAYEVVKFNFENLFTYARNLLNR